MVKQKHYVLIGSTLLTQPDNAELKINDKLDNIPTFEAELYNSSANRTALGDISPDLKIYSLLKNQKFLDPVAGVVSSQLTSWSPSYTWDGDFNTAWWSLYGTTEEWIEFDLGADKQISGCRLYWKYYAGSDYAFTNLRIQVKPDGGAYTEVINQAGLNYSQTCNKWMLYEWPPGKYRYVKVFLNTPGVNTYKYVSEFEAKEDTLIFTGRIEGEDDIEYLSRRRIRISGYHKMIELAHAFFLRLSSSGTLTPTSIQADDGGVFTNETTDGTNATVNDVTIPITALNDAFYIGYSKPFQAVKMKYSTAGVYNATVAWEYWNGSSWTSLTCLDETQGFTKAAGTRYLIIPNKPADWVATAVNGTSAYYIRMRVSAFTSATTQPLGDQFWLGDEDIARIQYDNIAANSILQDILNHANIQYDRSYTIAECPTTAISLRGEYDSHLKWISEIAAALTWTDGGGDKHEYDWWIDGSNGVHIKQRREVFTEASPYDISAKLQVLNRKEKHKLGNRIWGLGYGDGINQLRNIREHTGSQATYGIRDAMFSDLRIVHVSTLNEKGDMLLGKARAPAVTIGGSLRFEDFLDAGLQVGDWVKVHQPEWGANNAVVRLRGFELDPDGVSLEVSNEMESVSTLINALQRNVDVLNKTMQGATNIYQVGPLVDNFENAKPAYLYVYIPTKAKTINDVRLNYKLPQFRADSTLAAAGGSVQTSSTQSGHNHGLGVVAGMPGSGYDVHLLAGVTQNSNIYAQAADAASTNQTQGEHSHTVDTSHMHATSYGVVESAVTLPTVTININGTDRFTGLNGDQADLDITQWMVTGWNTIRFTPSSGATPNGLGRIQADCVVQCFIESR